MSDCSHLLIVTSLGIIPYPTVNVLLTFMHTIPSICVVVLYQHISCFRSQLLPKSRAVCIRDVVDSGSMLLVLSASLL